MTLDRRDVAVAAFAAGGPGAKFDPLQAQNLLFLIDREVSERIGGPFFDFRPYLYGPIDCAVDEAVENMVTEGLAESDESAPIPRRSLTEDGRLRGERTLGSLPARVADYFGRAARWTLLVPIRRALVELHLAYPEMAVKDVARELGGVRPEREGNSFVEGMIGAFDLMGATDRSPVSAADEIRDVWREVGADIEDAMGRFGKMEGLW